MLENSEWDEKMLHEEMSYDVNTRTCVKCAKSGYLARWLYQIVSIDLEPDLRKWLVEFADEHIEAFKYELKGAKQEPQNDVWHRITHNDNFCWWDQYWLEDKIILLEQLSEKIRDKKEGVTLLLDQTQMIDLCSLLKEPKWLVSHDEYNIRQIKMATRVIEIIESQKSDDLCCDCIRTLLHSNSLLRTKVMDVAEEYMDKEWQNCKRI